MEIKRTFGDIEEEFANFKNAKILLQSIPYDGTSTWGKGANLGFEAFLEASENMELYDIETDSEVYKKGIHILDPIIEKRSPEHMYLATYNKAKELLKTNKFLTFFGGEHSISIGIIQAFKEQYKDLSVLQIDAHADLRPEYLGSSYNHACAMHLASKNTNLVQVGIRSMDSSEREFMNLDKCFYMTDINAAGPWMDDSIKLLSKNIYISLDLDALDPSIMPSTGTPEPGGFAWYQIMEYLKQVFLSRNVVGFDIVELAPIKGLRAPNFLTAKLYYKMLSYKYHL